MFIEMSVSENQDWRVLHLKGRLDALNWPRLNAYVTSELQNNPKWSKYAIDLRDVEFMNLLALRGFESWSQILESRGGHFALIKPNPLIRKHLDSFGGSKTLKIYRETDELYSGLYFMARAEFVPNHVTE